MILVIVVTAKAMDELESMKENMKDMKDLLLKIDDHVVNLCERLEDALETALIELAGL